MDPFFDRSLEVVSADLVGKILQVKGKTCVISQVLPRTAADNARWLKSKPLFVGNRPEPVDVYVSAFRGNCLLFFRTGEPDTCVRLEAVRSFLMEIKGPGRVGHVLELDKEATGDARFDPETQTITITWHQ